MKKMQKILILPALIIFLSSCSILKKDCDCPKFGKNDEQGREVLVSDSRE
jgi:hypothetical protein